MRKNQEDALARQLTFVEFQKSIYWWDSNKSKWFRRIKDIDVVGRMVYAHPTSGEHFYLRMLLNIVRGATSSFEEIRTVDGITYNTIQEACYHRGLFESDREWHSAIQEASNFQCGKQLRELL